MSPVVVFTVGGRTQYLSETLYHWSRVRGIEDATLIFRVEPGNPVATGMCHSAGAWCKTALVVENRSRLGVAGNTWNALELGFQVGEFVIVAEEDTPVSVDVLEYFDWAQDFIPDRRVKAICAHQIGKPLGKENEALRSRHFSPVVWATWLPRWRDTFRERWGGPNGFDYQINQLLAVDDGLVVIPAMSRSQHIGERGEHCGPELFGRTVSQSWRPHYGWQEYELLPRIQAREGMLCRIPMTACGPGSSSRSTSQAAWLMSARARGQRGRSTGRGGLGPGGRRSRRTSRTLAGSCCATAMTR